MRKSTGVLLAIASFLGGVVAGFMVSPIKHGISIGNHSGNHNNYHLQPDDDDDWEWNLDDEDYFDDDYDEDCFDDDDEEELKF